jgi:phosphomannomutase
MAKTGCKVSELAAGLPRYHRKLGKVAFEHGALGTLMQGLEDRFRDAAADRSDGLKLQWADRWVHVRASNTEPLLRLAAEARDQQTMEDLYATVTDLLSTARAG